VDKVRLDKWLWAARIYKTRALASEAVSGGKVYVNGQRVKPGRSVDIGDNLCLTRNGIEMALTICALSDRRGSASIAQSLYEESAQSVAKRQQVIARQRLIGRTAPHPPSRPDKKARRDIARFRGR
jgi:ribosome-associated heat shock protein Hsp15